MTATAKTTEAAPEPEARAAQPLSYEAYLEQTREGRLAEWVDGRVVEYMPPNLVHQRIVVFLTALLQSFVRLHQLGSVLIAPFTMRGRPDGNAREPDIFFVAHEHADRLTPQQLQGPADLIVEVISDESTGRDRGDKFYEYQEAGVPEYWMLDPRPGKQRVDLYVLDETGRYQPVLADAGVYRSTVLPGFWLREEWLWADEPSPLAALAEIVGVERVIAALRAEQ